MKRRIVFLLLVSLVSPRAYLASPLRRFVSLRPAAEG
jgi:hypothetical protein